jgi:hypothetical protein
VSEPDIRIGDAEREEALKALGEHMSAGRLELDEYGDRSALVTTAKTRGDLLALFADLPQPHPRFGEVVPPVTTQVVQRAASGPLVSHRVMNALVPLTGLLCVLLFFTVVRTPMIFLLVPVIAILVGTITGEDQRKRDRRRRR